MVGIRKMKVGSAIREKDEDGRWREYARETERE